MWLAVVLVLSLTKISLAAPLNPVSDVMLHDEPAVEGSGSEPDPLDNESISNIPHLHEEEDDMTDVNTIVDDQVDLSSTSQSTNVGPESTSTNNSESLSTTNNIFDTNENTDTSEKTLSAVLEEDDSFIATDTDKAKLKAYNDDNSDLNTKAFDPAQEEGSGDESSGDGELIVDLEVPHIPACHVNCSTPGPLGEHDEENASPPPSALDQARILFDDINVFKMMNPDATSTTEKSTPTATVATSPVAEESIVRKSDGKLLKSINKDVEVFAATNSSTGKISRADFDKNSPAIFILAIIVLLIAVVSIACIIKHRHEKSKDGENRRNRRGKSDENNYGEELKPMTKKPEEKSGKAKLPEGTPLLNGNGKEKDSGKRMNNFVPLAHPEIHPPGRDSMETLEDIFERRDKNGMELLTPPRERVTIRASELPDSIPKTPVLVHRQKNSEGEIITTPVSSPSPVDNAFSSPNVSFVAVS